MPSFAGLIAGALGGAAEGYGQAANMEMKKQSELDLKKQLMDAQAEKELAVDAVRRQRDIADIGSRTMAGANANREVAPIVAGTNSVLKRGEAESNLENAPIIAAANSVLKRGEAESTLENAPTIAAAQSILSRSQAQNALDNAPIQAKASTILARSAARDAVEVINTPGYLDAVRAKAKAGYVDSAASLASAATSAFDLGIRKDLNALQTSLSKENDPAKREDLQQQIRDLSGNSTKSFSDVVAMGNGYAKLAGHLRTEANGTLDPDEKKSLNAQAEQYEAAADSVFKGVKEKRLPGGGGPTPKPGAPAANASAPYQEGQRLKDKAGKFYTVKNGVPVPE